jgi:putative ABC transport system permease protein
MRQAIQEIDKDQPLGRSATFDEILGNETGLTRFTMTLFGVIAAVGLALAVAGIYSVLSYLVSRRTREIGIRMALGAHRSNVLGMILGDGLKIALIGVGVGLAGSFAAKSALASLLFGVTPGDPLTLLAVAFLMILVALLACYLPARRATRVNPMSALRCD